MALANITNNILTDSGILVGSLLTTSSAASTYVPYTGATADLVLGNRLSKANSFYADGDGSFTSGGLFLKQYASGATNITGYNIITTQTSGFLFSASVASSFKNFILDASSLTDVTQRTYTLPDASGTLALTSSLSGMVTGTGTTNYLPKFTGASTIGNSNITDNGSLISLGSNSLINGNVGIGSTPLSTVNLYVFKTITGGVNAFGIYGSGTIQSDVTAHAQIFRSDPLTAASAFTLSQLSHFNTNGSTLGAGSSITTQNGYFVGSNFIQGTNNYGFRGSIPAGTNRWNLFMDGTANNYIAGSLGIGTTSMSSSSLVVAKTLTGGTTRYGIYQAGQVQSDVTTLAIGLYNQLNTAGAAFTLPSYVHLLLQQGTIGATSSVTNQYGIFIDSTMTGATNNYGIYSSLAAGTNRWNLYFAGTAANYMAGKLLIGTTTDNGQGTLQNTGSAFLGGLQVGGLTFSTSTTATTSTIFYYFNGGSGQTLTLPSTVGISSYFLIKNAGTADLTISRSGSTDTIMAPNGTSTSTTISLAAGSQAILVSNGAFVWIQIV